MKHKVLPTHYRKYEVQRKTEWCKIEDIFKVCCKFDPDSRPTAIEILAMLKEEHKNHEEILVGSSTERGYFN